MPATAFTAHLIGDAIAGGTPYAGPATVYLALTTTTPSATVPGVEITAGSYERKAFAQSGWTNDGAGGLTNTADIAYVEATVDYDGDVIAVEAYTASTVGTRLWYIVLTVPKEIVAGQTPTFLAGDLELTVV